MRLLPVVGLLMLLGASPRAQQITQEAAPITEQPDVRLVDLDRSLQKAEDEKRGGRVNEAEYQESLAKFRTDLEAAVRLIKMTPPNVALHARILSRLGDSEQASAALDQALDQDPEDPKLRVAMGQVRYDAKDYAAALAEADAVLARDPSNKAALALKYSSEGRIGTGPSGKTAISPKGDGSDLAIPGKKDISPQAQTLIQQAIAARREGDMERSWKNIQAAMNADPTSTGVQKLYLLAQKDQAKHAQTRDDFRNSQAAQPLRPIEQPAPKDGVPLWPIGAGLGLTVIGYGVAKSKGAWSDTEAEEPVDEDPDSLRIQRNRRRFRIAGVSAAVGFGLVYGGLWVAGTAGPFAAKVLRDSGGSLQRVAASQAGAVNLRANVSSSQAKVATEETEIVRQVIIKKGEILNRVWHSDWNSATPNLSGPIGASYCRGNCLPIDAASALQRRGLGKIPGAAVNNAQRGAIFRAKEDIVVFVRRAIGGVEEEIVLQRGDINKLELVAESVSKIPAGR